MMFLAKMVGILQLLKMNRKFNFFISSLDILDCISRLFIPTKYHHRLFLRYFLFYGMITHPLIFLQGYINDIDINTPKKNKKELDFEK